MRTFFTADNHFGHARVISLSGRPFDDVREMDETMIATWNTTVRPDDVVWHLGDFAYRNEKPAEAYFHRLNGTKHLVSGNHDPDATLALPWASISQIAETVIDKQRVVMCHYPLLEWRGYHRGAVHLFGHVHGNRAGVGRSADVGVDVWDFRPVTLPEIMQRIGDAS